MNFKQANKPLLDLFLLGGIVLFAFSVKLFYANSSTADLRLFLAPVSRVVAFFTGADYQYSAELGYFFPQLNISIERSCSGVNFFVMAFCMVSISTLPFYQRICNKAMALGGWAVLAFVLTICANSSRILIAISGLRFKEQMPWLAADNMHEAQGGFVYLFFLIGFFFLSQISNEQISIWINKNINLKNKAHA